jgi:mono/diheme cytochrome c family protein
MKEQSASNDTRERDARRGLRGFARNLQPRTLSSVTTAAMLCLVGACGSDSATPPPVTPPTGIAGSGLPGLGAAGNGSVTTPIQTPTGVGTPTPTGAAGAGSIVGAAGAPVTPGDVQNPSGNEVLPCNVSKVFAGQCQSCHGAAPIGGAPMPLVTWADLHKAAKTQPTMKVYQVVQTRIHDTMRPMPPLTQLKADEMTGLDTWLKAGAPAGVAADKACDISMPTTPGTVTPGNIDGTRGPLVPGPGETCYDFKTHNGQTMADMTPYDVGGDGEHYEQFYFDVPWPKDSVATAYATKIDNAAVLHHWLLFATDEGDAAGSHKTSPLPTLIGVNPVLLAGWAVGGPNLVAPAKMGFELPDPGKRINVQWHFYNSTGMAQKDGSAVQICIVPKAMRENIGGVTWLGTEDLGGNKWTFGPGMPAHQESTFTTTCVPGRRGMNATDSIHIIGFEPHMHRIGKHMKTSVKHTNGMVETIFDKPFSFGNETHYYQDYELKAGEQLITSCTFNNDNDFGVPFGESSDTEMCYQFSFAYPAHALSNGAPSLLGVTDTCW